MIELLHEYMNDGKTLGYIINEHLTPVVPRIIEKNDMFVAFNAIIQDADNPNRNKRRYPSKVLMEGLQTPYLQERLKTKSLYGECG